MGTNLVGHDLQLKLEDTIKKEQSDFLDVGHGMLGCCSLYRDCSRVGHCLKEGDYYIQCAYRKNLEQGKIFYTEKANEFSQERYDYIVNFRRSLSENEKNAFDEILIYFEKTKRNCQKCLCLNTPLIADVIKKCNAFELISKKDLVRVLFKNDLISCGKATELHNKYSSLSAPEFEPLPPLLSKGASKKQQEERSQKLKGRLAKNLKTWEKHFLCDSELQQTLFNLFLYFKKNEYSFELNEFFLNNYNDIALKTSYLIFFDVTTAKIFRETIT